MAPCDPNSRTVPEVGSLPAEIGRHRYLRDPPARRRFPGYRDAEALADTLEEITDLGEMLAEIIRSALDDEAFAAGLSTRLSDMKVRIERFERER